MSKSVNRCFLLGNIGRDPDCKFLPSGQAVANLSLATEERFKDAQGAWQSKPEWHACVAYGKTAEIIRDYVKKGSQLYVEGRIQTRSWESNGEKKYKTEIVVGEVVLLGGKGERQDNAEPSYAVRTQAKNDSLEITDDDLPPF